MKQIFINTHKSESMIGPSYLLKTDEVLRPIYEGNHIVVRHAADSAVPGLYTIRPVSNKEYVIDLSDAELALFAYLQRKLRFGLKTLFNVEVCGAYIEEHPNQSVIGYTIPFYIDRLSERFSVDVYQLCTAEYLKSYMFSSSRKQINAVNTKMREMFDSQSVRDDINNIEHKKEFDIKFDAVLNKKASKNPSEIEIVLEVSDENEIPIPPEGRKYFVCIGGSKNYQCFLCDKNMSKGEFLLSHEKEIDYCLKPVYSDDQIIVRQDSRYAIPGFYIVSPRSHYRSIADMSQATYEKCMFMARNIKHGLLQLGIRRSHIYHDEKYKGRMSAHFWVLPLHEHFIRMHNLNTTIYSRDIWTYQDTFPRYNETKSQILEFNEKMRRHLMPHKHE